MGVWQVSVFTRFYLMKLNLNEYPFGKGAKSFRVIAGSSLPEPLLTLSQKTGSSLWFKEVLKKLFKPVTHLILCSFCFIVLSDREVPS